MMGMEGEVKARRRWKWNKGRNRPDKGWVTAADTAVESYYTHTPQAVEINTALLSSEPTK